jgi:hypothetical protein
LRAPAAAPYARPVSWSAQHEQDSERDREQEQIRPPDPQEADPAEPLHRLASSVGNQGFSSTLAREGAGILPGGQVHPDVQSRIDGSRGTGASLESGVRERFEDTLGDLSDVRVHADDHAHELNRSVSARAFATGTDVFFAKGEYQPGSADGDRLIAHELAHVVQQRGAPAGGSLTVSEPGDALEREADDVADTLG